MICKSYKPRFYVLYTTYQWFSNFLASASQNQREACDPSMQTLLTNLLNMANLITMILILLIYNCNLFTILMVKIFS